MKTKHISLQSQEDIVEGLLSSFEDEVGSKIFTLRILSEKQDEQLDLVIAFENKDMAFIGIELFEHNGKLAARVKGDFL